MQTSRFVAWSLKALAKGLTSDTIPDGSKNCYHVLTQLNKKGLTRIYAARPSRLIAGTEPHVQPLSDEPYLETGMGPQGSAGVRFSVFTLLMPDIIRLFLFEYE